MVALVMLVPQPLLMFFDYCEYINWVGENIHRMLKARLGTHSGAVKGLLAPYHAGILT